ncbi:MAG: hypothetical protein NW241_00370 [Bacteroidia bacterium]|nr:hypothetical protein [Bacteroidia bacterium]
MALADDNLDQIRARILDAYTTEEPLIHELRKFAKELKIGVRPIRPYSANAVSFVSADGGDNRLLFNPAVIELVRVVDSRGNQCALDAIGGNAKAQILDGRGRAGDASVVPPLERLCYDLNLPVTGLSYLLNGLGEPGKSTGAIRIYRDIVEWAVLYDLLHKEWGGDTIIVREGLLRTKSFQRRVFPRIDQQIRQICQQHRSNKVNVSIVGVAKQSAVISRLAIALELEEVLHKPYPCFVAVPNDVEAACYNFDRTWLDTLETSEPGIDGEHLYQSMGKLYLVKFGDSPFDPVWPVDIAEWDISDADRIIGQLLNDAQPGFPIPDFPMCIQKAHDFAKVGGIEMAVLQDMLFDGLNNNLSPVEQEKVLRIKHLSENLTNRRYKNA